MTKKFCVLLEVETALDPDELIEELVSHVEFEKFRTKSEVRFGYVFSGKIIVGAYHPDNEEDR